MVEVTIYLNLEPQQKEAQVLCKMTSLLNKVKRSFASQQRPWGQGKISVPPPAPRPAWVTLPGCWHIPGPLSWGSHGGARCSPQHLAWTSLPFPLCPCPCPSPVVCAELLCDELIHHPNPKETFCLSASRTTSPVDAR